MQIKLIQTEIEDAIRNYIQEQVTVKEGMEINIDLSATRGPEGFIANVEIVRAGTGTQTAEVAPIAQAAAPATSAPVRQPAAVRKAIPIAKPVAAVPAEAVEAEVNENAPAADVAEIAEEAPAAAAEATEEAPATPAPSAGRSLFGGLSKPTNS
jgi:hypothetical protein